MFQNNNSDIYKVNIYNNIFRTNTTLVEINYILSMTLFKRTFEHKIAKNTPRIHEKPGTWKFNPFMTEAVII